jgi:hypothetical protein
MLDPIDPSLFVGVLQSQTAHILEELTTKVAEVAAARVSLVLCRGNGGEDSDDTDDFLIAQGIGETFKRVLCTSAVPTTNRSTLNEVIVNYCVNKPFMIAQLLSAIAEARAHTFPPHLVPRYNSQSKTVHDIAAARVRDARCSPVKDVQISLEDLQ